MPMNALCKEVATVKTPDPKIVGPELPVGDRCFAWMAYTYSKFEKIRSIGYIRQIINPEYSRSQILNIQDYRT